MTKKLQILAYRSILGMYANSIIEDATEEHKSLWWYKNAYKVYKKCKGLKKLATTTNETNQLKNALKSIENLEEYHFVKGEWNPYALIIMCLYQLVNELGFIELKSLLIDIDTQKEIDYLDKSEEHKDLQKISYRYFTDIVKIIEG